MAATEMPSAITIREVSPEPPSSPNSLKRRRSTESEHNVDFDSKRQRTNGDHNSPRQSAQLGNDTTPTERDASAQAGSPITANGELPSNGHPVIRPARKGALDGDEKQRSKRLFGALLGNLNPKSAGTSERRSAIEERRKAELAKQDAARAALDARNREEVIEWRRSRQGSVERDEMRIRHRNMIERARFLVTVAEPTVYYRPWDLRPEEEDRIERQVAEIQARVHKEVEEFVSRYGRSTAARENDDARPSTATAPASDNTEDNVRGVQREDKEDAPAAEDSAKSASATTNIPSESHDGGTGPATEVKTTEATDPDLGHDSKDSSTTTKPEVDIHPDKDDDHLIDGDEDTVIY